MNKFTSNLKYLDMYVVKNSDLIFLIKIKDRHLNSNLKQMIKNEINAVGIVGISSVKADPFG